jgi:stearoyl-CoA desaturase (delta-9 desaturase)
VRAAPGQGALKRIWHTVRRWCDSHATGLAQGRTHDLRDHRIDWQRAMPFFLLHAACLLVFVVGWSWFAVGAAVALYFARMFAVTGFYHRYFSHKAFSTSRPFQFVMAVSAMTSMQRGPLWWAAHHRRHHVHSDRPDDVHSPIAQGFWWSHLFWMTSYGHLSTDLSRVPDLARYPELRWLDRFDVVVPAALALLLFLTGELLAATAPSLGTNGLQLVVWGFVVSTMVLLHCTCTINSLAHLIGRRRYATNDHSRNSLPLALLTLGEGWHNNHHHYPVSARQGFYWWEIDVTYYLLRGLAAVGLIWGLRGVPEEVRATRRDTVCGDP